MRLIFSEFPADYDHYRYPYQVWLLKEKKDNLAQIYTGGWLPFRSKPDLFYLSRSTRVRLSQFKKSSENRRILRKTGNFRYSLQPIKEFEYSPSVQKFCKTFIDRKFGKGIMPTAAIRKIFNANITTHLLNFYEQDSHQLIGYVPVIVHDHFLHYAYPFYDLEYDNPNTGMGMMLHAIIWAQKQHKQFVYLGTCYSKNSLYKTQFSGFEFFNGFSWSNNLDELKYLINKTSSEYLLQDENYRELFLDEEMDKLLSKAGTRIGFK